MIYKKVMGLTSVWNLPVINFVKYPFPVFPPPPWDWHSLSGYPNCLEKLGSLQDHSQDFKSGCPKCAIGPVHMNSI